MIDLVVCVLRAGKIVLILASPCRMILEEGVVVEVVGFQAGRNGAVAATSAVGGSLGGAYLAGIPRVA